MSVLSNLAEEISGYAKDYIKLEIINFDPSAQYGDNWEVGESGSFQVKITNNGNLDIKNLRLRVNRRGDFGLVRHWSPIGPSHPQWDVSMSVIVFGVLSAGQTRNWGYFGFKAQKDTGGIAKDVVEVHVAEYDVSLDSLLYDKTNEEWSTSVTHAEKIRTDD